MLAASTHALGVSLLRVWCLTLVRIRACTESSSSHVSAELCAGTRRLNETICLWLSGKGQGSGPDVFALVNV